MTQTCHLNWYIIQTLIPEVTITNYLIINFIRIKMQQDKVRTSINHFTMTHENTVSLHVQSIFGTVYQMMLSMLTMLKKFKARLDKFWMHQDVKFDFTADLTGIGDRSVRVICDVQFCI